MRCAITNSVILLRATNAMPITVLCHCGRKFSANDRLAGRSINCPSCGRTISVPPPASDAADEDDELTLAPDPEFDEPQVPEHSVPREDELKSKADEIRRSLDKSVANNSSATSSSWSLASRSLASVLPVAVSRMRGSSVSCREWQLRRACSCGLFLRPRHSRCATKESRYV